MSLQTLQNQMRELLSTVQQQQTQINHLQKMERNLHKAMDREIEQRYDLYGADYHHIVETTFQEWQQHLDTRVETSRKYTQKLEQQYETWLSDIHTRCTDAEDMTTSIHKAYSDCQLSMRRHLQLAQSDIKAHIKSEPATP